MFCYVEGKKIEDDSADEDETTTKTLESMGR